MGIWQQGAPVLSRRSVLGVALGSGLALAGCGGGGSRGEDPLSPDLQQRLQRVLDENRARFDFPGAIAGAWTPNGSWSGVSGVTERGGSTPPALDMHTRIGSITKTFTVMLILKLVDRGLIGLDDTIDKYVPGLPGGNRATLRMLASMTSGIPSYTLDPAFVDAFNSNPQAVFTPQQLLDYVRGKTPDFEAGTRMEYSNSNTIALGLVVEQKTELPFAQALQKHILGPLGLTQTLAPTSNAIPDPHWRGITIQGNPEGVVKDPTDWNPSWAFSAGNMISTLDDLHHWAVVLGTGKGVISAQMQAIRRASMHTGVPPNTPALTYALGFGVFNDWIGHTGELPGFNTSILYHPDSRVALVALVNSDIAAPVNGVDANPADTITSEFITALGA